MARDTPKTSVLTPELRRISIVVVLGTFISILDTTIVAVALDTLSKDFHVSVTTIQWVSTGYLLALAVVIPVSGWAVDRFGAKPMWMMSVGLFVLGSALCGLAWSANSLIVFRVLQGIGGGMILPIGQSIMARAAGPQSLGRVMSVVGVPMVMGPVLGPVLGGLILSNFSWRWIFYVNVPIGFVTLILASRFLTDSEEKLKTGFDALGFCLLSPGLAALVYSLSQVGATGSFSSRSVVISFMLGIVLMGGFIWHALGARNPLLELHLFRDRGFAIANITMFFFGATLYGSMFLLPLYYQVARGLSPWQAGLLMAPQGLGAASVMRLAGRITDRAGPRRIVPAGILVMCAATIPFAFVSAHSTEWVLAVALFVRGIGFGLCMTPITSAAYLKLSHADVPRASTTINIMRQVGGSVAVALFAVVLQREIIAKAGARAAHALATTVVKLPPKAATLVTQSFAHTFWWSVATVLVAFVPSLFLPSKPAKAVPSVSMKGADEAASAEPVAGVGPVTGVMLD
jgi:EmrB/QacA subfamily drug resistance transporter